MSQFYTCCLTSTSLQPLEICLHVDSWLHCRSESAHELCPPADAEPVGFVTWQRVEFVFGPLWWNWLVTTSEPDTPTTERRRKRAAAMSYAGCRHVRNQTHPCSRWCLPQCKKSWLLTPRRGKLLHRQGMLTRRERGIHRAVWLHTGLHRNTGTLLRLRKPQGFCCSARFQFNRIFCCYMTCEGFRPCRFSCSLLFRNNSMWSILMENSKD